MSEWKEFKFSEFVSINPPVKFNNGPKVSFVEMKDLSDKARYCSPSTTREVSSGARFEERDTLFARITPCLENGKISQVKGLKDEVGLGSTEFLVFRGKEGISDTNFVYYLSRSDDVRSFAEINLDGTSGRQRVPKECFDELKLVLPCQITEQKVIAAVLSSLDDKIDLLHRQNATLEAMAETLFRKWFVVEAKEDWDVCTLGDVIEIFDGKRVPLSRMERDMKKEGVLYPYYGAAQVMDYINDYIFDGEYILLGEDGTVRTEDGYPVLQYATGKFWVNNHTHVLRAKAPYSNFFLWNYLAKKNIDEIVTGAVQPKINQGNLKSLSFPHFPDGLVNEFNNITQPMLNKIQHNKANLNQLEKLRDTILPKLMSGEVRVKL